MNLWLYTWWFEPDDFGRVTLVSGSLDSAAEEVVGIVGSNSPGENLNTCCSCSDQLACSEACCRVEYIWSRCQEWLPTDYFLVKFNLDF